MMEATIKLFARLLFPVALAIFLLLFIFGGLLFGKKGIEFAEDIFFDGYLLFIE